MPIDIGIDLIGYDEVAEALRRGDRYLRRVYTDEELDVCGDDPKLLAACWAAKEAMMKALHRTDEPVPWRSISVRLGRGGSPSLELSGSAAELARERGVTGMSVSVSHHRSQAAAVVLAVTEEGS